MKRNGIFRRCLALLLAAVIALAPGASALAERNDTAFCATPGCVLAAGHEGDCRVFDCSFEPHSHTDACYNADGALICGRSEQVLHTHDDACCNAAGELVCGLPELAVHTHTDSCYTERQVLTCELPPGHTHDDTCYEPKQGELTCDIPESEEHSHGAECYAAERGELLCDIPESEGHTHGDGCYVTERELSCGLPEIAAHTHTAECCDAAGALTCGLLQPAAHQHGEECFRTVEPAPTQAAENAAVTADGGISQSGDIADLAGLGIYPAKAAEAADTWVVYDTGDAATAAVKAVITLPEDVTVTPNCYPFIRRINEGENFYPDADALQKAVGAYNDVQCYMIHWVELNEADNTYNLATSEMEKAFSQQAVVALEYIKPEARLGGAAGARKLKVFSSNGSADGTALTEISDAVQAVDLDPNEGYKGFTFKVSAPCPYVFVSKKVEKGYVKNLVIQSIKDGTENFDASDTPGNDSSDHNKIVRSYDVIQYNLAAIFSQRSDITPQKKVNVFFEMVLYKSATAARFKPDAMLKLSANCCVEYLDKDDNVIMVMAADGKFYEPQRNADGSVFRNEHGFTQADKEREISLNSQLRGSLAAGGSYKVKGDNTIVKQRFTGWLEETAGEDDSILNATREYQAAIEVRNADNGEEFTPMFRVWLDGNADNYGPETNEDNKVSPAQPVNNNTVTADGSDTITVSAGTNFNLQLKKNSDMSYKNWFDFARGQLVAEADRAELERLAALPENHGKADPAEYTENGQPLNDETRARYANYRYGRITCYGITLQLYNDTDNNPAANRAGKGLKGLSLPVGDITFDLDLTGKAGDTAGKYTPILWDYNENIPAHTAYKYSYNDPAYTKADGTIAPPRGQWSSPRDGLGNGGRNLYWDGEERSDYAKGGAPSSYQAYHDGCYYGGDWELTGVNGETGGFSTLVNPQKIGGNGSGTTYNFKVSDYDFDFDNQHFPLRDAGNSGNITDYEKWAKCFSAGCVQVLSVFPRVQQESVEELPLHIEVSNLKLQTRAGQVLAAKDNDTTKIAHEVNQKDNKLNTSIVLYAPGNLTKGSSFNGKTKNGNEPKTVTDGFLGTEYWTESYDCNTFAGDEIWLISYGMMASGSDYHTKSMNLLQLFDSRALSVRGDPAVSQSLADGNKPGSVRFLYAADPDYPDGYDTNKPEVLQYMNTVREEDLVYSEHMPAANGMITVSIDGTPQKMKCIGVLMEMRGCDLLGGKYQYMRIPVKVNGDDPDLVCKTVATVNTFRTWSYDLEDITWANGEWNTQSGKNELAGYQPPYQDKTKPETFEGELANPVGTGKIYYVKAEYENGQKIKGHEAGTLGGNSLLILSYKSQVHINVADEAAGSGAHIYEPGAGQTVVAYRLNNIKTLVNDLPTQQTERPKTELTVRVELDSERTADAKRLYVASGSFAMNGEAISTDKDNPTEVTFTAAEDNKTYTIKVYAEDNHTGVNFHILDAPVGIHLPDITFNADFASIDKLANNDSVKTSVYISGAGDNRAYSETAGNMDNVPVGVVVGGGAYLNKAVDRRYMELNGQITYTVSYVNNGAATISTIYFYDLLPCDGDVRNSAFKGEVGLGGVELLTRSEDPNASPVTADVYYSTVPYKELYAKVRPFGGEKEEAVEALLAGEKVPGTEEQYLYPLGSVKNGKLTPNQEFENKINNEEEFLSSITGLYVKVNNLSKGQRVELKFTIGTQDNQAGDIYNNFATCWVPDSGTDPLISNRVFTQVVSRSISGLVWYDRNLNGIRDAGEPTLPGVTATLFRKDGDTYVKCAAGVGNTPIAPLTTGETALINLNGWRRANTSWRLPARV